MAERVKGRVLLTILSLVTIGTMAEKADKKKLLYVITKANWGGAQRYVYELAERFSRDEKYDVAVALGGEGILKEKLESAGIRVIPISGLKRDVGVNEASVFWRLYKIFKEENPDILHLNSPKAAGLGTLAGRLARVPKIIYTVHGWTFREDWRPEYQKVLIKFFSWLTILFSHKVICVSEYDARQARDFPFTKERIATIHNGIPAPQFLLRKEARRILGISLPGRTPLWIGTIGELHKNKGHKYAILAVEELVRQNTDVIFVIIGAGEEKANLDKLIHEKALENHVFFFEKKENASSLLPAFDLFLFPSVKEGMPYVVLEAGFAALPIIASSVGGIPEIITDMESGILIRPKDAPEIVRAIHYLLNHSELMEKFAKKLHAKTARSFSIERMLEETEKVYREA